MFFRKSTSKLLNKLTRKHGYRVAYCMVSDLEIEMDKDKYACIYYVLVKDGKMFGLVPTGIGSAIDVIPFSSELVGEPATCKSDFVELRDLVESYGYTLNASILKEAKVVQLKPVKE